MAEEASGRNLVPWCINYGYWSKCSSPGPTAGEAPPFAFIAVVCVLPSRLLCCAGSNSDLDSVGWEMCENLRKCSGFDFVCYSFRIILSTSVSSPTSRFTSVYTFCRNACRTRFWRPGDCVPTSDYCASWLPAKASKNSSNPSRFGSDSASSGWAELSRPAPVFCTPPSPSCFPSWLSPDPLPSSSALRRDDSSSLTSSIWLSTSLCAFRSLDFFKPSSAGDCGPLRS